MLSVKVTFDLPWGRLAAKTWGRASGGIELVYNNVSREGQWTLSPYHTHQVDLLLVYHAKTY